MAMSVLVSTGGASLSPPFLQPVARWITGLIRLLSTAVGFPEPFSSWSLGGYGPHRLSDPN